ncbi:MAG: restriction endonuclease subunit S [Thauera sp.]|nr:restriction endonuclease subunit S [Thauera sp.]
MGVKPGYKRTEVGVIPEEWHIVPLKDIAETSSGTTPSRSLLDRYFRQGKNHWVKTLDLNNSELWATDECVTDVALTETSLRIYPVGTVLIAMYGGFNQIGRTGLLRIPAAVNQAITAVQPDATLFPAYLLATLNFRVEHWKSVASSSRKDPNITSQDIREFPIPLPPLAEQRAIATALSDVDALLAQLDRLIAKKRDIKQAAMQQLLTGKTRLPGFDGEWQDIRLREIATFRTGPFGSALHKSDYTFDGVPVINPMHIIDGRLVPTESMSVTESAAQGLSEFRLRENDLVIGRRGEMGRCAVVKRDNDEWLCGTGSMIVRTIGSVDPSYLQRVLASPAVVSAIEESSVGSTMTNLNQKVLGSITVPLPALEEQTAISTLLSDLDAELTALEARRDKTRALKQGMMQELLTGRTRLV